jgi:hypothetical protein
VWDVLAAQAPTLELGVNPLLSWGRILLACGIAILVTAFLSTPAAAGAERSSGSGQLVLWLLGLRTAQEQGPQKVDINSASVAQLGAVPGMDRRQALRIVSQRPYATLQDLTRAGLSPAAIERLAEFLALDSDWPSASPRPAEAPGLR